MAVGVGVEAAIQWQEDRIQIGIVGSEGSSGARVIRLRLKLFCITEIGNRVRD